MGSSRRKLIKEIQQEFIDTVKNNKAEGLRKLTEDYPNEISTFINKDIFKPQDEGIVDMSGFFDNALSIASKKGYLEVVWALLNNGADINKQSNGTHKTPIETSIAYGRLNVIKEYYMRFPGITMQYLSSFDQSFDSSVKEEVKKKVNDYIVETQKKYLLSKISNDAVNVSKDKLSKIDNILKLSNNFSDHQYQSFRLLMKYLLDEKSIKAMPAQQKKENIIVAKMLIKTVITGDNYITPRAKEILLQNQELQNIVKFYDADLLTDKKLNNSLKQTQATMSDSQRLVTSTLNYISQLPKLYNSFHPLIGHNNNKIKSFIELVNDRMLCADPFAKMSILLATLIQEIEKQKDAYFQKTSRYITTKDFVAMLNKEKSDHHYSRLLVLLATDLITKLKADVKIAQESPNISPEERAGMDKFRAKLDSMPLGQTKVELGEKGKMKSIFKKENPYEQISKMLPTKQDNQQDVTSSLVENAEIGAPRRFRN